MPATVMTASHRATLPDADALARDIAAIIGGAPDRGLAERLLALCGAQLTAAGPALDRVEPGDEPAQHAAALRDLAKHG